MKAIGYVFAVVSLLLLTAAAAGAGVPDPTRSSCFFPAELPCPDPATIDVILRDAFDIPVASCSTGVTAVLDSGMFLAGQITYVGGRTGATGAVSLTFPDGIRGLGSMHFAVTSFCVGEIGMCSSDLYGLACGDPVSVDAAAWGRVKALYR